MQQRNLGKKSGKEKGVDYRQSEGKGLGHGAGRRNEYGKIKKNC